MFLMNCSISSCCSHNVCMCGSKSESLKSGCRHDKRTIACYYWLRCIAWKKNTHTGKKTHTKRTLKRFRRNVMIVGRKTAICACISVLMCGKQKRFIEFILGTLCLTSTNGRHCTPSIFSVCGVLSLACMPIRYIDSLSFTVSHAHQCHFFFSLFHVLHIYTILYMYIYMYSF